MYVCVNRRDSFSVHSAGSRGHSQIHLSTVFFLFCLPERCKMVAGKELTKETDPRALE